MITNLSKQKLFFLKSVFFTVLFTTCFLLLILNYIKTQENMLRSRIYPNVYIDNINMGWKTKNERIKEVLNCDTSIIINNGEEAGEKFSHVVVNVIPRNKDDKINFNWNFKKIDETELNELTSKLKIQIKKEEKVREEIKERQPYKIRRIP